MGISLETGSGQLVKAGGRMQQTKEILNDNRMQSDRELCSGRFRIDLGEDLSQTYTEMV